MLHVHHSTLQERLAWMADHLGYALMLPAEVANVARSPCSCGESPKPPQHLGHTAPERACLGNDGDVVLGG